MDIFCRPLALLIAVMVRKSVIVCSSSAFACCRRYAFVAFVPIYTSCIRSTLLFGLLAGCLAHSQHIAVWEGPICSMLLCGIRLVRCRRLTRRQSIDLTFGVKHLSFLLHNLLP
ncbi:hypothetical protein BDR07DRAFT_238858 [Suillus spraguei]|nr:hypothetical protein BDR07DRAFT_238858 [Suillus spraguei]